MDVQPCRHVRGARSYGTPGIQSQEQLPRRTDRGRRRVRQRLHSPGPRKPCVASRLVQQLRNQRQPDSLLRLDEHSEEAVQVGHRVDQLHGWERDQYGDFPDGRAVRRICSVRRHSLSLRRRAEGGCAGPSGAASAPTAASGSGGAGTGPATSAPAAARTRARLGGTF